MTDEPVDLCRVRKALAELDRLAAEHPDRLHKGEPWSDNLEQLDEAMSTPARERVAQYRERKTAKGMKQVTVWCPARDAHHIQEHARTLTERYERELSGSDNPADAA
ncbi:MAG: hypothetical protein K9L88_07710 [Chromatiaceae bacterium]|nr:hypothetical protein [Chromatiaceae bacterium]